MKKLISLLLCLVLCLPALAMAEADTTDDVTFITETIECDDYTLHLNPDDYYEVSDALVSNAVHTVVYPSYNPADALHDNYKIVWKYKNECDAIALYGAEPFAKLLMQDIQAKYDSMGIKISNSKLISATFEDNIGVFYTYCTLDYTGYGYDLVSPMYQMQIYFPCKALGVGTWVFTASAATQEGLEAMVNCLEITSFK